jgi:hypothetical protein
MHHIIGHCNYAYSAGWAAGQKGHRYNFASRILRLNNCMLVLENKYEAQGK